MPNPPSPADDDNRPFALDPIEVEVQPQPAVTHPPSENDQVPEVDQIARRRRKRRANRQLVVPVPERQVEPENLRQRQDRNKRRKVMRKRAKDRLRNYEAQNAALKADLVAAEEDARCQAALVEVVRAEAQRMRQAAEEAEENALCCICRGKTSTHSFSCGHMVSCLECADKLWNEPQPFCPLCREPMTAEPKRIFLYA